MRDALQRSTTRDCLGSRSEHEKSRRALLSIQKSKKQVRESHHPSSVRKVVVNGKVAEHNGAVTVEGLRVTAPSGREEEEQRQQGRKQWKERNQAAAQTGGVVGAAKAKKFHQVLASKGSTSDARSVVPVHARKKNVGNKKTPRRKKEFEHESHQPESPINHSNRRVKVQEHRTSLLGTATQANKRFYEEKRASKRTKPVSVSSAVHHGGRYAQQKASTASSTDDSFPPDCRLCHIVQQLYVLKVAVALRLLERGAVRENGKSSTCTREIADNNQKPSLARKTGAPNLPHSLLEIA